MLRLSKLTDYATVILSFMAKNNERVCAAMELATATGIALPTVSKILKALVNAKVLISTRGAKGGYAVTECSISQQGCEQAAGCNISGHWNVINLAIYNALESVTLADMIKPQETLIPIASLYRLENQNVSQ